MLQPFISASTGNCAAHGLVCDQLEAELTVTVTTHTVSWVPGAELWIQSHPEHMITGTHVLRCKSWKDKFQRGTHLLYGHAEQHGEGAVFGSRVDPT